MALQVEVRLRLSLDARVPDDWTAFRDKKNGFQAARVEMFEITNWFSEKSISYYGLNSIIERMIESSFEMGDRWLFFY
jgi:hypothetical protein